MQLLFFFLSFDESVAIHESLTSILPAYGVGGTGAFTFAWVIPYGIAAIALFVVCFRFLLALPTQTKRGFMIAGGVFVLGAIGIEMIAAGMYETSGGKTDPLNFALLSTVEETLEMTGLIIFIHYILQYTAMQVKLFPSKL